METQERLRRIDPARLTAFQAELLRKEYSVGTAENYLRAARAFARWSGGMVDRRLVLTWVCAGNPRRDTPSAQANQRILYIR